MSLTVGIVGLPNVGKSTLFNAITKASVLSENYPFATIEANVGIVAVADPRLAALTAHYQPKKSTPATVSFTDIAGLVKGASHGEGLGNKFLANVRVVDAICHVVRCFASDQIIHVYDRVDPVADIEVINYELMMSDLEVAENRLLKIEKKARLAVSPEAATEVSVLTKIKNHLLASKMLATLALTAEEKKLVKAFGFLTLKPQILVLNVDENSVIGGNAYTEAVAKAYPDIQQVLICAELEAELNGLSEAERAEYLATLGLVSGGLDRVIKAAYDLLGLATFFTVGPDECKAWPFLQGLSAPECAGLIHTDFQKGFIKVEIIKYADFTAYGSAAAVKAAGKMRIEGRDYHLADGDIALFRFNV